MVPLNCLLRGYSSKGQKLHTPLDVVDIARHTHSKGRKLHHEKELTELEQLDVNKDMQ